MVSVLVTTYQHAPFIAQCLDSILEQQCTFPVELVIGEDESSDGTRQICERYAKEHPSRIRLVLGSREDVHFIQGRPTGRANILRLLRTAKGKYVALCEGDDHWADPLKLQKQVEYLEGHPECVITYHDASTVDRNGTLLRSSKMPDSYKVDRTADELSKLDSFILTLSVLFRNQAFLTDMPPEFYKAGNGDNFLTSMLGLHGSGHYMAEVQSAVYRVHGGGVWSSQSEGLRMLTQYNTWMWMAAYYNRVGRYDLAEYFIERVNKRIRPMIEFNQLRHRKAYQWFARVMGWLKVSLPR